MKDEMSLAAAADVVLRRPRWVVLYPLLVAVLAVAASYLIRPRYLARVDFIAERLAASGGRATLSGMAGNYGLNILTDVQRTAAYYVSVLESRHLAEQVLESRVRADSVRLLTLLDLDEGTRAESLAAGVGVLQEMARISDDPRTGIIHVAIETTDPELSASVAMRYVHALNEFNMNQRQSLAGDRRRFLESRIASAERGVRAAEESLRRFYQSNPGWAQRPTLVMEGARLRDAIDGARDIQLTLQREQELARVEEMNDIPVLTVVDPAVAPLAPSWPRRIPIFVGVLVVAMLLGIFAALLADYVTRSRTQDPEAFARLSRKLQPWRRAS